MLALNTYAADIEPVKMTCTQVNPDGSVTFFWYSPTIPTSFKQFVFYHSSNGSNFSKIDSTDVALTFNYTHIGINANNSRHYYYVEIVSALGESAFSDTISTIYLQVDNNIPDYNKADIYFNKVAHTPPFGSNDWYGIYWDYPDGNFTLLDSITTTQYSKDIIVCKDSINFIVENGNILCSSFSNIRGDWFKDNSYPNSIEFDSVSISNSKTVLGWEASSDSDLFGYILYRNIDDTWQAFDTIEGINNTFFTDTIFNPCETNIEYAIAAIDTCGNRGEGSYLKPQRSILIHPVRGNICLKQDTIVWEQYLNSANTLEKYIIYRSSNGIDFEVVGETSTSPGLPTPEGINNNQMWFVDENIEAGNTYTYFVQAVFGSFSSSSCKIDITINDYKKPEFLYFANSSVNLSNEIELEILGDTSVNHCNWDIYRSIAGDNNFENISSFNRNQINILPISFIDELADAKSNSYDYYSIVSDSCGFQSVESNVVNTILLSGSKPDEQTNVLNWNIPYGWETDIEKFYIHRLNTFSAFEIIDTVDAFTNSYTDFIADVSAFNGRFSYRIEAVQQQGGIYDYQATSFSNVIELYLESKIFFANAFKPSSTLNPEFKPILNFFAGSNYNFQIYNRWGQLIFETTDYQQGWDGTYQGQQQMQGLYVYKLTYTNIDGLNISRQGTFMLVE